MTGLLPSVTSTASGAGMGLITNVAAMGTGMSPVRTVGIGGSTPLIPTTNLTTWYDPSDLTTLFQDAAGTTPVTSDNDPVGKMLDKSGLGNHATQSNDTLRPLYKTSGGLHWLDFDGTTMLMDIPTTFAGAASSDNTIIAGSSVEDLSSNYIYGSAGDLGIEQLITSGKIRPVVLTTAGTLVANGTTVLQNAARISTIEWDRSAGTLKGWDDQALEVDLSGTPADKRAPLASWLGQGSSAASSGFFDGKIYGVTVYDAQLSDDDRNAVEVYMAGKSGVTL